MRRSISLAAVLAAMAAVSPVLSVRGAEPMDRKPCIEFVGEGDVDTFREGALLFTDREYVVRELPADLRGERFLRRSIDAPTTVRVAEPGVLIAITPDPGDPGACAQGALIERRGFTRVTPPDTFQLFGKSALDIVRVYRKTMATGEILPIRKYIVLVGFESARQSAEAEKSWAENRGERLYNGIVLPETWPPVTINMGGTDPMPVPYLHARPAVVPIDVGRQLFVDSFLIEETDLERTFHLPKKYEGNPILEPETELELNGEFNAAAVPKSGGVWWDPVERIFKMWYEAGWIGTICYATSKDGLKWERPSLDVNPGTNQVLPPDLTPDSWTVVPDWDAKDRSRRYTMRMQPPGATQPGWCMTSADGIHWTNRTPSGPAGDRSTHFYNPFRKKWVHSIRSGGRGRARQYWESDDFLADAKWGRGEPAPWAMADRGDLPDPDIGFTPQLYNLDAVAYESIMLGMFEIHRGPENPECHKVGLPKITELNFAYSRDGFHWHRPDRRAHIPAERRDVWDRGYVQSIGNICTVRGDKLWIYYTGFQGDSTRLHDHWRKNGMYDRGATGLAFLRRDGFASLDAGKQPGTLTTRAVTFSGTHLFVNVDAPEGLIRAAVLDQAGQPIEPFTLDNCHPVTSDSTLAQVAWKASSDLSALRGKPVRFRFELTNGSVYAFWVSRDETGRSDGYVAGGGPGYTGLRDTVGRAALGAEQALADAHGDQ